MSKFISGLGDDENVSDEIFLARMRYWRGQKLALSDWTQLPDVVCDKAAWAKYRQALRDLPASNADIRKIEVPDVPK